MNKDFIISYIEKNKDTFTRVSDSIWERPEVDLTLRNQRTYL